MTTPRLRPPPRHARPLHLVRTLALGAALAGIGCDETPDPTSDAAVDAGSDARAADVALADAGPDTNQPPDLRMDPPDMAADRPADPSPDRGTDLATDVSRDASVDIRYFGGDVGPAMPPELPA